MSIKSIEVMEEQSYGVLPYPDNSYVLGLSKHPFFKESIYNWINIDSPDVGSVSSLYKSQYSSCVKDFYDKQKSPTPRTMGYMRTPLKTPQDYLKKHSGERKLEAESKPIPCQCREYKQRASPENFKEIKLTSSVPRCSERNFLMENSLMAQKTPATVPEPRIVDDRNGHSFQLNESGWVPKYTSKEDYGQKPKYIEAIDKSLEESRKAFKEFLAAERQLTKPVKMSEETKLEIFEGVVRNWKELLRRYLMLPVQTDTFSQQRRKLEIERRIKSLEQDIELLLRQKDIFIGKNVAIKS